MDTKERIARLLAKGMRSSLVASVCQVQQSYISNLGKDPDFVELVKELSAEALDVNSSVREDAKFLNDRLLGLEHQILDTLSDRVELMESRDLSTLLDKIGIRRDRLAPPPSAMIESVTLNADGKPTRMTRISLPAICAPDLTIGGNNEIISIGNRSVNPMPVAALQAMLDKHAKGDTYEHSDNDSFHTSTG